MKTSSPVLPVSGTPADHQPVLPKGTVLRGWKPSGDTGPRDATIIGTWKRGAGQFAERGYTISDGSRTPFRVRAVVIHAALRKAQG